jgi:hypothetical protein
MTNTIQYAIAIGNGGITLDALIAIMLPITIVAVIAILCHYALKYIKEIL